MMQKYFIPEGAGMGELLPNRIDSLNTKEAKKSANSPTGRAPDLPGKDQGEIIKTTPETSEKLEQHSVQLAQVLQNLDKKDFYNA